MTLLALMLLFLFFYILVLYLIEIAMWRHLSHFRSLC